MAERTTNGIRPPILSQFVTLRFRSLINRKPIVLPRSIGPALPAIKRLGLTRSWLNEARTIAESARVAALGLLTQCHAIVCPTAKVTGAFLLRRNAAFEWLSSLL